DGKETNAILLWDQNDFEKFNQFEENSREHSMKIFAEGKNCRRQVLLDALGAEKAYCSGCDVCDKENGKEVEHFFDEKKIVLDFIKKHKRRFKKVELITHLIKELNFWANKNGLLSIWEHDGVEEILENLFLQNEICTLKKIWRGRITTTPHPKITN
ncbi:MAG: ATP-dependent DNA helicase RecQ, partial [Treponema sp.]|nr:ATP-dependent DNA helicase RecQ [Treponema sp.]